MFVFLDESGSFFEDDYFIVGGFLSGGQRRTAKAFRKWQHQKFPKKIRAKTEVKFDDTGLTHALREKTLAYFASQDIRIFYTFLNKANIPLEYRTKRGIESGHLYTEIVAQTLDLLFPNTDDEFFVLIDQRQLKKVTKAEFKDKIELHLQLKAQKGAFVRVDTDDSTTNANIQIADWICGALFHYHMRRPNGKRYYEILKNNIVASREMFEDFWGQFSNKKHLRRGDLL